MSDLLKLSKPFPAKFIRQTPGSNSAPYIGHSVITQRILANVGAFDAEVVQVIRGYVPEIKGTGKEGDSNRKRYGAPAINDAVVAVVYALTLTIDGRRCRVEEIGECGDPHNWGHDGARIKDAVSDAIKRCGMRFGVGLQLWAIKEPAGYFLHDALKKQNSEQAEIEAPVNPDFKPDSDTEPGREPANENDSQSVSEGIATGMRLNELYQPPYEEEPPPIDPEPPPEQQKEAVQQARAKLPPPIPDPEPVAEPSNSIDPDAKMTGAQNRKIFALLNKLGVKDTSCVVGKHEQGCRHAYVGSLLDEEVETFKDLTQLDAAAVIEQLVAIEEGLEATK